MLIVCYDFAEDKIRSQFAKFLTRYGRRVQYSVFEIENSSRVLDVIKLKIKEQFEPRFGYSDSILIFTVSDAGDKVIKYGYASNEDSDLVTFE